MSGSPAYSVGIDLGTTNSVIAYTKLGEEAPRIELLNLPQVVATATIEDRKLLPSFLYLGTDADRDARSLDLPWGMQRDFAVGELARKQSADVPTRTVVGAKSWLAYSKVDRRQPILPWNAPADVAKVSPVEASKRYLEHIAAAWNAAHPESPLKDQQVVLTVPASFDAAARDLTREAAISAGLPEDTTLLEEPQAALYAWLADHADRWRRILKVGDTLLVADVGGGTTDFTLIGVTEENGELALNRVAVGNHTLVGGDNMDLALAYHATTAFASKNVTLDPWQSVALWHSCRAAKEVLLAAQGPAKQQVSVLGRGKKVIGGTVSVDLEREAVRSLLVDGFFPACTLADKPHKQRASGFRQIGLPFETDTAVTRHLAAFLSQQGQDGQAVRPTHLLFNGGVFKAAAFRERLTGTIGSWFGGRTPEVLSGNNDLDFAVARGAAYYGAAKRGKGVRIRGGTARSYYVGIETAGLAIPGAPRPLRALCVVPFGMEEGSQADVPSDDIGLVVGEPATFRFFSAGSRKTDMPGDLVDRWAEGELEESDSLEANLPRPDNVEEDYVPVKFQSRITELGVLELWCVRSGVEGATDQRWKLEFGVREDAE
ncbi:Hsp70 family protein [Humisphaera borealis]|uniref:Hsp70 family protein n=1 Tax=Humisphaera borealis TaxID=2807512 RepID=A0A7M2WZG5_9BACT|nr:Hsp70 family protein [Humisphaera borealis]QOV90829.1 Hsp70 family protein [Humisphaera borealis]